MNDQQQYYVGLDDLAGYGELYFLKLLQEAGSPGGGESLLGSVVQKISTGLFGWGHGFPAPMVLTAPQSFLGQIPMPPAGPKVLDQTFAAGTQVASIKKEVAGGINVGPFPTVPASLGLDLDWSKGVEVKCVVGAGSVLRYIPRGYSATLYRAVGGDDRKVDATGVLRRHFIVESVLLARRFTVEFLSSKEFGTEFQAKLDTINSIPNIGGKFKLDEVSKKSVTAEIDGATTYLIALGVARWSDFDLD